MSNYNHNRFYGIILAIFFVFAGLVLGIFAFLSLEIGGFFENCSCNALEYKTKLNDNIILENIVEYPFHYKPNSSDSCVEREVYAQNVNYNLNSTMSDLEMQTLLYVGKQKECIDKVIVYKKMDCDVVYCSDAEKILKKQNTCFHFLPLQGIS
ncbi:MAG: hypothetical protein IPL35_13705 [Sphingobacteriales bacterium]|nr:hypothetical protein [Sphingobacteriales bacterium]